MPKGSSIAKRLALIVACLAALGVVPVTPAAATVPVLVLDGTGYGHGVGLSQWGAQYLARTGRSTEQILGTFYPGASLGRASGPIRVVVHRPSASTTTLTFPNGGEVRSPLQGAQAPGFPIPVAPGGRVRVTFGGAYRVDGVATARYQAATPYQECLLDLICPPTTKPPATTTTTAPHPPEPGGEAPAPAPAPAPPAAAAAAASAAPVWAVPSAGGVTQVDERGRAYRGVVEATGGGALRLVNHVDVEDYLRGMKEVPGSWPAAAVQAQTIAARTYGLRAVQASGEICDDARCQVYVGRTAESPGQSAAVAATAGQVVTYGGALAAAVYSADAGGVSATTFEGFGTPDGVYPYLTTVHYETDNPLPWRLEVGFDALASRLGYPGTLTGVRVAQAGPSQRALTMALEGSAGEMSVDGRSFARALGLRSTRFTASSGTSETVPPPPPPADETIQALPDDAGSLAPTISPGFQSRALEMRAAPIERSPAAAPAVDRVEALDPRRYPVAAFAALVLVAAVAGAQLPFALARRAGRSR